MKPLAQTFRIDPITYRHGMFLTSVELYFESKPTTNTLPVGLEVRSVENGVPTEIPFPGSQVAVSASNVNVPSTANKNNLAIVQATSTKFTFDEPVYLSPGYEYAVVVHSNSTDYKLYTAKIYDFVIGTTEKRVSKQSGLKSLFLNTSGEIWSPDVGADLMIKLNKASFEVGTTRYAYLENNNPARKLLESNPILTDSGGTTITMSHPNHGFVRNDIVTISGLDSATTYNGVLGSSILGQRTITAVDHTGYQFAADSSASSSLRTGGDGVIVTQQHMFDEFQPLVSHVKPFQTLIDASVKLTTGASYANNRNSAINSAYSKASTFTDIILNEYTKNVSPQLIANTVNEAANLGGSTKSFTLKLDLLSGDSNVSPIIDLQRASISSLENIIDRQDSAASDNFNIPLSFVNETDPQDGSSASKHITKPVSLALTAVGLKIILAANRPNEADFDIYYRTAGGDEVITDKNWTEVPKEGILPADEDPDIFREYEYLAGGQNGSLVPFSIFQIKVVFTSTNSSKVARIRDLRAIALAT